MQLVYVIGSELIVSESYDLAISILRFQLNLFLGFVFKDQYSDYLIDLSLLWVIFRFFSKQD